MAWRQTEEKLRSAGFSETEIVTEREKRRQKLRNAGFAPSEIQKFMGDGNPDPDMSRTQEYVKKNVQNYDPEVADDPLEFLEAGLQMSVSGLALRGERPDVVMPEDTDIFSQILYSGGMLTGDLPAVAAGFIGGGAAGSTVAPGPGTVVGAGSGAAALPAFLRETLMDHYKNGDFTSFKDYWTRMSNILGTTGKEALAGGAAGGVGGRAQVFLRDLGFKKGTQAVTRGLTEAATYTGIGGALRGEVPDAQDFVVGGAFVLGFHGTGQAARLFNKGGKISQTGEIVAGNLRSAYAKTGLKPVDVAKFARRNPVIRQETMARDINGDPVQPTLEQNALPDPPRPKQPKGEEGTPPPPDGPDSVPADAPEPAPEFTPTEAESSVLSRVAERTKTGISETLNPDRMYRQFVNQMEPIIRLEKEAGADLPPSQSPSVLARQTLGSDLRASYMLRHGAIEVDSTTGALRQSSEESYLGALSRAREAGGSMDGLKAYMLSKRALELADREVESGIDISAAQKVVDEGSPVYEEAFQQIQRTRDAKLKYAEDSGLLSPEAVESMKSAGASYVPFKRVLEGKTGAEVSAGRGLRVRNPVKKISGSKEKIVDPIISDFENFHTMIAMADRNRAMKSLVDMVENDPEGMAPYVQKAKRTPKPVGVELPKDLKSFLETHGMTPEDLGPILTFRQFQQRLGPNEAAFFRNGKPEIYEFTDPDLASLYKTAAPKEADVLTSVAMSVSQLKRAGITMTPDFPTRASIRDQLTAAVLEDYGYVPYIDFAHGLMSTIKKDKAYKQWVMDGGAGAALTSMDANYFQRDIHRVFSETGVSSRVWNTVKHPVEAAQLLQEYMDSAQRVGLYKRMLKDFENATPDQRLSTATATRKAFLDFAQTGSLNWVNYMTRMTPFLRPNILGMEQLVRALKRNPRGVMMKGAAAITIPSIALWELNMAVDPEGYQELPRWQRDLYWILPPMPLPGGGDVRIRIPKPPVIGQIFGSMTERFLDDTQAQDPRAWQDFDETLAGQLIPPYIPAVALPIMEAWGGESTFTGKPLIPRSLESASGYLQYTEYTTEIAKNLSKFLSPRAGIGLSDVSPIVLENYVRGWAGSVGTEVLRLLDAPLKETKMPWQVADIPVVQAFVVREPTMQSAPIQDFYTEMRKLQESQTDLRLAIERQDLTELERSGKDLRSFVRLNKIREALSTQYSAITALADNDKMTMDEKRQFIESTYAGMIETAKAGLAVLDEIEKAN